MELRKTARIDGKTQVEEVTTNVINGELGLEYIRLSLPGSGQSYLALTVRKQLSFFSKSREMVGWANASTPFYYVSRAVVKGLTVNAEGFL